MEADTISYLWAVCQHRIHRNSLMARQKSEVFDDLVSDGLVRIDEEGNYRITNGGKRLKEMLGHCHINALHLKDICDSISG